MYQHKITHITTMLDQLSEWMDAKGFSAIADFQGKLSRASVKDPYAYQRAQYVDMLMKPFKLLAKYPQV